MEVLTFSPFGFEAVSYLVYESGEAILVDAGVAPERVAAALTDKGLVLKSLACRDLNVLKTE